LASAVWAAAEVYGPTATSEADQRRRLTRGEGQRRHLAAGVDAVTAARAAPNLHRYSCCEEPGDVAFDGPDCRAGTRREGPTGHEAGRASAKFLDQSVLTFDQRQRLVKLPHAGGASGADQPRRSGRRFLRS
jgi:hypothetical protein